MSRLTPEMRRFVEAVAHDASIRTEYPRTQDEWRAAERLYGIATALLAADAGEICAACNGSGESGPDQACAVCRGTGGTPPTRAKPAPTPADRDAELERLLIELEQACYRFSDMVSTDNAYAVKSAEAAIRQHVASPHDEGLEGLPARLCQNCVDFNKHRDATLRDLLLEHTNLVSGQYTLVGDEDFKAPYRERLRRKQVHVEKRIHDLLARRVAEAEGVEVCDGYVMVREGPMDHQIVSVSYGVPGPAMPKGPSSVRVRMVRAAKEADHAE